MDTPKLISFFNNKGGVGKTTLACNFAHYCATIKSKKTLVIDMDPQANSTQLLLDENQWFDIYKNQDESSTLTVANVFKDIKRGETSPNLDLKFYRSKRFEVDLLAGHPTLSTTEDHISSAWVDLSSKFSGFKVTNWMNLLKEELDYELIIADASPSLGALNRSLLIGSDAFITPLSPDMFSMYSLDNISTWTKKWMKDYNSRLKFLAEDDSQLADDLEKYKLHSHKIKYIGYTVQEYISKKNKDGSPRSTKSYDYFRERIPEKIPELLWGENQTNDIESFNLGTIPYMFSLPALAQQAHAPIQSLAYPDGLSGARFSQRDRYSKQINDIFSLIFERIDNL